MNMNVSLIIRLAAVCVLALAATLTPDAAYAQSMGDRDLTEYWEYLTSDSCTFCDFSGRFVQITDAFSRKSFDMLAPEFAVLTSYVFSIYFLIQCAKLIVPFGPVADGAKIIWETIVRMIAFFFVMWALTHSNFLWDGFYEPAVRMSMKGATAMMDITNQFGADASLPEKAGTRCGEFAEISKGRAADGLDPETIRDMTCQVQKMEKVATAGILIGWHMTTTSNPGFSPTTWGPAVGQFLAGALLIVIFFFTLVTFPFFYIDLIFRLGLICALMPIFLFGFVFPWTRQFLSNAVKGILASLMTLVVSSAVYGFAATLISYAPMMLKDESGTPAKNIADMLRILHTQYVYLDFLSPAYQFLLVAGLVALILSRKVSSVVQTIFEFREAGPSMASQAQSILMSGAMMAGGATMVVAKSAGPGLLKGTWGAAKAAGQGGVAASAGVASLASPAGSGFQQAASNLAKQTNPLKNFGWNMVKKGAARAGGTVSGAEDGR